MALISFNAGDHLYKYQLNQQIGGGHSGQVWLAQDLTLAKNVAVKILDENMAPVAEILNEAKVGNRLEHANVVHVHYADVVQTESTNVVVIAMDFHPQGSAAANLNSSNFMPISEAVRITIDVLRGLEYLHESALYHNDIKPSNILIGPQNEGLLTDYGISCVAPGLAPAKAPSAYVLHRAPETFADGNISVQTDIYQVGLTLFRLINGIGTIRDLRDSVGVTKFEQLKARGKIPRMQDFLRFVPSNVRKIIRKATAPDTSQRYQSALDLRRALEALVLPGYWTTNSKGEFIGVFNEQVFRFSTESTRSGYKFHAYRKRLSSGVENRVGKMSDVRLDHKRLLECQKKFMLAVVAGEL